jgi:hypothetical protein
MTIDRPRARRCAVPAAEPLIGGSDFDYADSFEIRLRPTDSRSPEQAFRTALDRAPVIRMLVPPVHRYVLGMRLGPLSSSEHLLGWKIVVSTAELVHLEAVSPLAHGHIVGRNTGETASFTTYLFYTRPAVARTIWTLVSPLHRAVAPYLLQRGNDGSAMDGIGSP